MIYSYEHYRYEHEERMRKADALRQARINREDLPQRKPQVFEDRVRE